MTHPNTDRDERVATNSDKGRLSNHMARLGAGLLLLKEKMDAPVRRPLSYADRVAFEFEGEQYVIVSADLLDSQAAESNEWRTVAEKYQALVGRTETDAATRMRDRCVEKVRARVKQLACTCVGERADHHARCPIMIGAEMVTDLQSLTLEQGEQEKTDV